MFIDASIEKIIAQYGNQKENLLPVLQNLCSEKKWLSKEILKQVAQKFNISPAEVYSVATFYSFLKTEFQGTYIIRLCKSISCDMNNKESIVKTIHNKLQIKTGESTPDGLFSLEEVNCIGWCHKGPAMLINNTVYTELTPDKVETIIDKYMATVNTISHDKGGK